MSGGIKAVFEFANHLQDRNHDVAVIYPQWLMSPGLNWHSLRALKSRIKGFVKNHKKRVHVDWFDLKTALLRVPTLSERYISDADVIVATWWETAYFVNKYNENKGKKFYLVQHYEIWGGPEGLVNNSYKLGLRVIVNSTWLKNILQKKLDAKVEALIFHSPDLGQFYSEDNKRNNDKIRILMAYRKISWKGIEDGLRAFEIVRKKIPNIQLVMYGPEQDKRLLNYVEFYQRPSNDKLREIYNSCDIFLFSSHCEGFGMPPMEAMACKCAVVSTNVGAIPDYAIPGETALVSPPRAPELLAENIIKLVENAELRKQISEAGYNYIIKNFSWDRSAIALEQVFNKALSEINYNSNMRKNKV